MRTLIQDVTAITLDDQDRLLPHVDIALDGNKILAIGAIPPSFVPIPPSLPKRCWPCPPFSTPTRMPP
jgi:hypothetical protein